MVVREMNESNGRAPCWYITWLEKGDSPWLADETVKLGRLCFSQEAARASTMTSGSLCTGLSSGVFH
jgi:hypothetical protein